MSKIPICKQFLPEPISIQIEKLIKIAMSHGDKKKEVVIGNKELEKVTKTDKERANEIKIYIIQKGASKLNRDIINSYHKSNKFTMKDNEFYKKIVNKMNDDEKDVANIKPWISNDADNWIGLWEFIVERMGGSGATGFNLSGLSDEYNILKPKMELKVPELREFIKNKINELDGKK
jgi:4-diphosphocytidyl-2C-methyl-D-erythritol kinase